MYHVHGLTLEMIMQTMDPGLGTFILTPSSIESPHCQAPVSTTKSTYPCDFGTCASSEDGRNTLLTQPDASAVSALPDSLIVTLEHPRKEEKCESKGSKVDNNFPCLKYSSLQITNNVGKPNLNLSTVASCPNSSEANEPSHLATTSSTTSVPMVGSTHTQPHLHIHHHAHSSSASITQGPGTVLPLLMSPDRPLSSCLARHFDPPTRLMLPHGPSVVERRRALEQIHLASTEVAVAASTPASAKSGLDSRVSGPVQQLLISS
ncbi:unnamed protein product [Protopolystoma xenopodis]|uniref:Uncharacterized protein n=1 Tax=Protopolystoma xenopodis TaxID=117903 RepID=A0A448WGR5_9PLAT|nr:unnamed protein product [Protopolystoma xenopodis]